MTYDPVYGFLLDTSLLLRWLFYFGYTTFRVPTPFLINFLYPFRPRLETKNFFRWLCVWSVCFGITGVDCARTVEQIFSFLIFQNVAEIQLIFLQGLGVIGILLILDRGRLSRLTAGELLILTICAISFEPLWYFVAYFCGLHSPRHLITEFRTMRKETRFAAYVVMLALTILTLGIAAVSGSHLEKYYANIDLAIYQVIFIGLAALTVPHMCLLEWAAKKHG